MFVVSRGVTRQRRDRPVRDVGGNVPVPRSRGPARALREVHALATPVISFVSSSPPKGRGRRANVSPLALWIHAKRGNTVRPAFKPGLSTDSVVGRVAAPPKKYVHVLPPEPLTVTNLQV